MKYLIWLIVLLLGYGWWRNQQRLQRHQDEKSASPAAPQEMVACAHCGLHLPRNEALAQGSHYYCGLEHQKNDVRP